MTAAAPTREALTRLFQRRQVADLDQLCVALGTRSRMTVFRRLSTVGYLSSYSHSGRYYTLRDLPAFDADGLWQHRDVLFSRDGTLTRTLVRLVEEADAGQLHRELQLRVRLRVHNTLSELVADRRLGRAPVAGEYLYTSAAAPRAAAQLACRRQFGPAPSITSGAALTPALVIEVLVEVIRGAVVQVDAAQVAARLMARGLPVTPAQVEDVCRRHGVGKKTAPSRSRRSRR
jgi:hypothetical protein